MGYVKTKVPDPVTIVVGHTLMQIKLNQMKHGLKMNAYSLDIIVMNLITFSHSSDVRIYITCRRLSALFDAQVSCTSLYTPLLRVLSRRRRIGKTAGFKDESKVFH